MENANKPKDTIVYIQKSKKLYIYIYIPLFRRKSESQIYQKLDNLITQINYLKTFQIPVPGTLRLLIF